MLAAAADNGGRFEILKIRIHELGRRLFGGPFSFFIPDNQGDPMPDEDDTDEGDEERHETTIEQPLRRPARSANGEGLLFALSY